MRLTQHFKQEMRKWAFESIYLSRYYWNSIVKVFRKTTSTLASRFIGQSTCCRSFRLQCARRENFLTEEASSKWDEHTTDRILSNVRLMLTTSGLLPRGVCFKPPDDENIPKSVRRVISCSNRFDEQIEKAPEIQQWKLIIQTVLVVTTQISVNY